MCNCLPGVKPWLRVLRALALEIGEDWSAQSDDSITQTHRCFQPPRRLGSVSGDSSISSVTTGPHTPFRNEASIFSFVIYQQPIPTSHFPMFPSGRFLHHLDSQCLTYSPACDISLQSALLISNSDSNSAKRTPSSLS